MENNAGDELLFYKELPKEKRKALRKEYFKTSEAKKMNRTFIIVAVIFAVVVIAGAVIAAITKRDSFYGTFPIYLLCVWPAVISQQKFEKWLAAEKNIAMKRKK